MHVFAWLCGRATLNFKRNIASNIYDPGLVTTCSLCVCAAAEEMLPEI